MSEASLQGRAPKVEPPRVQDFIEWDKNATMVLSDYLKYITTVSGLMAGFYANLLGTGFALFAQTTPAHALDLVKIIILLPILFWFASILSDVFDVFPRRYRATTDYEKESQSKK